MTGQDNPEARAKTPRTPDTNVAQWLQRAACGTRRAPDAFYRPDKRFQCTIKKTAIHSSDDETPPIVGCDALLALANWIERRRQHDPAKALQDLATRAPGSATATDCPAESDSHTAPGHDRSSGGDAP